VKRSIALLALIPFSLLLVVSLWLLTRPNPEPASFTSPTRPAPNFDVATLDGGQVRLADFKGRPVVVNIWATWCAPCKLEHPVLVDMAGKGVEIVGILYKDPNGEDAARELLKREGNPFAHIGLDPLGDLGIAIGNTGVPESFLIDANGMIVKTHRSYFDDRSAAEFMAAYQAELAKSDQTLTPVPAGG
jgi:cytochrome c biogenesis protein CcmG/thiol:disulfide interchange protein DsbE